MMATSMDGTVAAVVFEPGELGKPVPEDKINQLMTKAYGKSYNTLPNVTKRKKENGTLVVENPELLFNKKEIEVSLNFLMQWNLEI